MLTTERESHFHAALGAMEQRQPILGVPTSQQPLEGLLRPPGQRPVTFLKPALVLAQESVSMVHQNAPQRALMDLLAPVANALAGLRTFHPLTLKERLCRPATGRLPNCIRDVALFRGDERSGQSTPSASGRTRPERRSRPYPQLKGSCGIWREAVAPSSDRNASPGAKRLFQPQRPVTPLDSPARSDAL